MIGRSVVMWGGEGVGGAVGEGCVIENSGIQNS